MFNGLSALNIVGIIILSALITLGVAVILRELAPLFN